eukprot:3716123-Prymnesium_polylepis.1
MSTPASSSSALAAAAAKRLLSRATMGVRGGAGGGASGGASGGLGGGTGGKGGLGGGEGGGGEGGIRFGTGGERHLIVATPIDGLRHATLVQHVAIIAVPRSKAERRVRGVLGVGCKIDAKLISPLDAATLGRHGRIGCLAHANDGKSQRESRLHTTSDTTPRPPVRRVLVARARASAGAVTREGQSTRVCPQRQVRGVGGCAGAWAAHHASVEQARALATPHAHAVGCLFDAVGSSDHRDSEQLEAQRAVLRTRGR